MTVTLAPPAPARMRQKLLLAGIAVLAAVLDAAGSTADRTNGFYAAAVRTMAGGGLRDLLFGTYDAAGVVTVDKPPLAFWPQVALVDLVGFHGWALLLPQVVEGVAAVVLLYAAVRRWAGPGAGLTAALVLALTPVTVVVDRDSNPDPLLVLLLVLAAYLLTRALARPGWLWLAGVALGLAFLTKMLQAWIVVPAFALAYLVGGAASWGRRLVDLLVAGVAMVAVGLSWVVLVDTWPAPKPFIGGSADGSAWNLVVGYNGLGRVLGGPSPQFGAFSTAISGEPGPLRLLDAQNAGQISWLLPLAALVLVVVGVGWRRLDRGARAGWVLWGSWLLLTVAVLSVASGIYHPYYAAIVAPALAAVVGAGVPMLVRRPWLLALGLVGTAAWGAVVVARYPAWFGWTGWAGLGLAVAAAVMLLVRGGVRAATALGLVAVLFSPAVWSGAAVVLPSFAVLGPANPTAGPPVVDPLLDALHLRGKVTTRQFTGGLIRAGVVGKDLYGAPLTADERALLAFAAAGSRGRPIALAVEGGAISATPWLLGAPDGTVVIGMGGFAGGDPAPTAAQLAAWVATGRLRFVVSPVPGGSAGVASGIAGPDTGVIADREAWVRAHCTLVPPAGYGATKAPGGLFGQEGLYDCVSPATESQRSPARTAGS